ncbi:MAG: fumarylacetoacetate hydrolase family protein [Saprospiraceae bacterium]|nr:fumarylacetoacetate hydrolase family protein [Saprospiraceae bacterium]MCF8248526.1 fumarylacetoacetate hydrolase family protein [Saprospiraceae bacterium]MCF8283063.1 fumarylacetoacetate hydrolase family protein [Bacteroidales bacterium]MCF8310260.1 fumarylacetoacetate hydrolase family protein [Saprospiraceae bacterium]MCF8439301.1 fumarylacetoacetate hydrolase family protein [Saprospiraceae bacterium]
MKLIRHGEPDFEKPGIQLSDGTRIDVSAFGQDFDEKFFAGDGLRNLSTWLENHGATCPVISQETRLGSPICRPSKIICVGLNYSDHATESNMQLPSEPIIFFKSTTAICGPNDKVIIPKGSEKTDWEVELAVVIGKKASYVEEADAMDYVVGYLLHNDISERAFQLERQGQWVKGKSADTFAPLGPFLATTDEIPDPHSLGVWLKVNGELLQNSNTRNLIFKIPHLVSYISQFMTLLPGDVISTGTPAGVGLCLKPPRYLNPGDKMELGIDGLGVQRQLTIDFKA